VDAQLAKMYQGILVYGGADDRVNAVITVPEVLGKRAVDTRYNEVCPPICGEDTHSLEGVFVDTEAMTAYAGENGFDQSLKYDQLNLQTFSSTPIDDGMAAAELLLDMSEVCKSKWVYDPDAEKYFRWEETDDFQYSLTQSLDQVEGNPQLAFENVIFLFSDYVVYDALLHDIEVVYDEDEMKPTVMLRDGGLYNGYWKTTGEEMPLSLFTEDDQPYALKPGRTWFVFVTKDSSIERLSDGTWTLVFSRP
jgi:hypothetical protein